MSQANVGKRSPLAGALHHRTLNNTIAIAGVGLATSQIASAVILAEIPQETKNPLAYQTQAFFWSLGIGVIAIMLTLIVLRIFRR